MSINQSRHILFLASWYPNRTRLSHGIFIKRHAEAAALNNRVSALHVCPEENLKDIYEVEIKEENRVKSVVVYYRKVSSQFLLLAVLLKFYRYVVAHFLGFKIIRRSMGLPTIIHLNVVQKAGIFALLIHLLYKIPMVISEHWSGYMPEDGSYGGLFQKLFTKAIFVHSKSIIVLSEKMKYGLLAHNLAGKYHIIPNVVDHTIFKPREEKKLSPVKKLVHISSINDREKNISGIIKAVAEVSKSRSDFQLEFIGDGEERPFFEKIAADVNLLNKTIFFRGYKNEAETADYLKNADCHVMFSNYEGLPCVLLESVACGVPIIATKVGGIPEYFSGKQGILVDSKDNTALVNAISHVLNNIGTYDAESLRNYSIERFGFESISKKLTAVYKEIEGNA